MNAPRLMALLVRHRRLALALVVAATAAGAILGGQVRVNNALEVWFLQDDPALVAYRRFQERFGNDEVVAIAVRAPEGVLAPAHLRLVAEGTRRLEAVAGVRSVTSLSTARFVEVVDDELRVGPVMPKPPEDAAGVEALRRRLEADPAVSRRLVSADGTVALLIARMEAHADFDARRHDVLAGIDAVLDEVFRAAGREVHTAGIGLVYDALNTASFRETPLFLGLCLLLVCISLFVLFRRPGPVLLALASVVLALGLVLGVYGAMGEEMNMVTAILPPLLIVVGVADTVHILQHRARAPDAPLHESLAFIFRPCLFTSLTTAVGFASLATARMQVIRELGLYAALGVLAAFVVSFVVCAAGLSSPWLAPAPRPPDGPGSDLLDRALAATGRLATTRPLAILGCCVLLTLAGGYGVSRLVTDTYSIDFFRAGHPVRVDSDAIEASYGRYMPLEFTVQPPGKGAAQAPAFLKALAAWQAEAQRLDLAGWSLSLADVVARLNQVLRDAGPEGRVVPDQAEAVAQALLMYESQPGNERVSLADAGYDTARVTFGVPMVSARGWGKLIAGLEGAARRYLPEGTRLVPGGYLPLYVRMMAYVVDAQRWSFSVAYLLVFALLGVLFRSVVLAAIAMLPNLLPIFVTLGLMGLSGIRLDIATVTIAAVVIGVVVDDTIHFLHRFRTELAECGDHAEAARRTLASAGRAIVGTSLILACGFCVMALATVKSIVFFGLLSAVAMLVALVADLLMLPALLVLVRPKV